MTEVDHVHTYGLVERFHIDHGELDGRSPQECFVLGVEFQMVCQAIDTWETKRIAQTRQIHEANVERVCKALAWHEILGTEGFVTEPIDGWATLVITKVHAE